MERRFGIALEYEREGPSVPIAGTNGIHVYRILQEALTNVARHSGANRAWVRLRTKNGAIELDVEDHGKGLTAEAPRRGLGIVAMRERAELLGGTVDLVQPPGGGTLVRLRIPLEARDAHDG
jgi:two-component system, NarL family, sensor histidine kinase UhpB